MAGAHGGFFFFIVTMMHIKNLGLHSDFLLWTLRFYLCLELLNTTMALLDFLFSSFDWSHEKYLVINTKFLIVLINA